MAKQEGFRLALQLILSISLVNAMLTLYMENAAERNVFSTFILVLKFFLFVRKRSQNSDFSEIHLLRLIVCLRELRVTQVPVY